MTQQSKTGKIGEDLACRYLTQKGYKIINRNHRQKWGEIDIITMDPEGVLVFVEVKTSASQEILPEDQMTQHKISKFKRACNVYANTYFHNRDDSMGWRLDVVAIILTGNTHTARHYENI